MNECESTRFYKRQLFSTSSTRGLPSTDRKYQPGPRKRSEGRTEGRKESTIRVETQRNSPHLRLRLIPLLRRSRKSSKILILGKQPISNRIFSFSLFFGMLNIFALLLLSYLYRAFEKVMSFVYELGKKVNRTKPMAPSSRP